MNKAIIFCLGMLVAQEALATAVKWWDEEGNVHYSDTPPSSGWTRIEMLSNQGIVTEVITPKPPKPPKEKETPPPKDVPVWLKSFGSEDALKSLRDKRIEAINRQISLARMIIEQLKEQASILEAQGDKEAASETRGQIEEQEAFIRRAEKEKQRIREQFRAYIACFRALKANHPEKCSTWNIMEREASPPLHR